MLSGPGLWLARSTSRSSLAAGGCAIGLALGMKALYSSAGADALLWILAPSAWLARFVGGIDLTYEPGAGFISHTHHLVIGPACAGINFLVICFLTLYFSFVRCFPSRTRWLISSAVLALGAAVVTNGLRIFVSAHLWNADIYGSWMTPERMHRLAGTAIYYASLLAFYFAVASRFGYTAGRLHRVTPFLWYAGISLGVPLAGRVFSAGAPGFSEHAAWVLAVASILTLAMFLPSVVRNRVCWKR
jgi:exosortase K